MGDERDRARADQKAVTSQLADRLMHDMYPEFSDRLAAEQFEAVITAEAARWQNTKIREFVPVLAAKHVRRNLRALTELRRAAS